MICDRCQHEYQQDPCPYCGNTTTATPPVAEETQTDPSLYCPSCGMPHAKVETPFNTCEHCGAILPMPQPEPFVYTPLFVFNPNYQPPQNPFTANHYYYLDVAHRPSRLRWYKKLLLVFAVLVGMFCYWIVPAFIGATIAQELLWYTDGFQVEVFPPSSSDDSASSDSQRPSTSDGSSGSSGSSGSGSSDQTQDEEQDPIPAVPESTVDEGESIYPNGISIAEYQQLEVGMSYAEVSAIIGGDGTLYGSGEDPDTGEIYTQLTWIGEYNTTAYVSILFVDQQLNMVYQEGLFE